MLVYRIITCLLSVGLSFRTTLGASTGDQISLENLGHVRIKRQVTCEKRYRTVTSGHTRCLQPSPEAESLGDVNQDDIQRIVNLHNKVRREVVTPAANMVLMSWDDSLAKTATRWAMNCQTAHDKGFKRFEFGRFSVGQNLAWGSYDMGWEKAVTLWADEKKDFTFGGGNVLNLVGHYTQMVWAESVKVGCGVALCGGQTYLYVCNYGPGGNLDINLPYKTGQKCGDCPSRCNNGLCDCGTKVCLNGGEMDLNTCTCQCSQKFHVPPDCGLNCTDIENTEPWQCPQYTAQNSNACTVFSNVPLECPKMCNICPDSDFRIIAEGTGDGEPSGSNPIKCSTTTFYILWTLFTIVMSFY